MDVIEFALEAMAQDRRGLLELVQGLTPRQLTWQPAPGVNTIGFLLLHIFRGEDYNGHTHLVGKQQVWDRDGWEQRISLPLRPASAGPLWTAGTGWTQAELAVFSPPLEALLQYGEAVRQALTGAIRSFDPAPLDQEVDLGWRRMPRGRVLRVLVTHEAEHRGHVELLLGMRKTWPSGQD